MRGFALCLALVLFVVSPVRAEGDSIVYSIQVRAVPLAEQAQGMATLQALVDRGYLAYAYKAEIDGKPWLRVAVGAFASRGAAADFGRAFGAAEGMDYFLAPAPIQVLPGAGEQDFVVTPSALWLRGGDGAREIFAFDREAPNDGRLPAAILPELAPDRGAIAFAYDDRLYTATVDGDSAIALTEPGEPWVTPDGDYAWRPGWSPSGRYVAFLDQAFWEYPIGLWVARADGGELRCLACNRDGQSRVRWFVWHPTEDRVLFVEGYAMGTVAVGGGLFSAEIDGTIRTVIDVEHGGKREDYQEIAGPLRIEDGFLHFRRVRWIDDKFEQTAISDERLPIDRL